MGLGRCAAMKSMASFNIQHACERLVFLSPGFWWCDVRFWELVLWSCVELAGVRVMKETGFFLLTSAKYQAGSCISGPDRVGCYEVR